MSLERRRRAARRQLAAQSSAAEKLEPPEPQAGVTEQDVDKSEKKGRLFGKVNAKFHDALQSGRGDDGPGPSAPAPAPEPTDMGDDLAIRQAKSVRAQRLVVPDGVLVEGTMTSNSDTEIYGKIAGDLIVHARLYLAPTAEVSGDVKATSCKIDAPVEGKVDCSEELEIGPSGRLSQEAVAGKKLIIGGTVDGNASSSGLIHVLSTAKVTGNIRARMIVLDEGAVFNGTCKTVRDQKGTGNSE